MGFSILRFFCCFFGGWGGWKRGHSGHTFYCHRPQRDVRGTKDKGSCCKPYHHKGQQVKAEEPQAKRSKSQPETRSTWQQPQNESQKVAIGKEFTLGTDFSGLETPSRALTNAGVPPRLIFCCEVCGPLRDLIMRDCPPQLPIYEDVEKRAIKFVCSVDMYVAGPSCPPWSTAGQLKGKADPRACHMHLAVTYITQRLPRCFLLENVEGLH